MEYAAGLAPGHEKPAHMRIVERRGGCVGNNIAPSVGEFNGGHGPSVTY